MLANNTPTIQEVDMTPKGKQEMEMNNRQRQEVNIFKRETSFLSYIVGDGVEIEKTQSNLNELKKSLIQISTILERMKNC